MLTLTSLLNGANLLTGNGVTAGSTPFPRSEPEPEVNGTDHSPAVKRLFPGTNSIIAQWDSLRERSRKYKLARKSKRNLPSQLILVIRSELREKERTKFTCAPSVTGSSRKEIT